MLSNPNHIINLSNYEEWLLLYADGELSPAQVQMVDDFLVQHPQAAAELDMLMAAKLPADYTPFLNKEELLAPAMKATIVDESLLLFIDDELGDKDAIAVSERLSTDTEFAQQYHLLLQTKVDASEVVMHPNKKELYRQAESVRLLRPWMRLAAAVLLLLLGSLYFLVNRNKEPIAEPVATSNPAKPSPVLDKKDRAIQPVTTQQSEQPAVAKYNHVKQSVKKKQHAISVEEPGASITEDVVRYQQSATRQRPLAVETGGSITQPIAVNKTITATAVTLSLSTAYNPTEAPQDLALSNGDFEQKKKTPARGFFRKVSRFIERRTGIGTVNADNELLIGSVALKLK